MNALAGKIIVVIDDTPSIRTFLRISFQSQGAEFHEAASADSGLGVCLKVHPDLVILDLGLPDRDGLEVLPEILANTKAKVIILSVRKESSTKAKAYKLGASAYVTKPFLMDDLLDVAEKQLVSA